MKRIIARIVLAAVLALGMTSALGEALTQTFATGYFTLDIPGDWEIDTSDLDKEDGYEELGDIYASGKGGMVIETGLVTYENLKDISLWNADEATMQSYIDSVLSDYADDHAEYVDTIRAGSIPFVAFKCQDEDGPYYYLDTMTNGYAIEFFAYVLDEDGETMMEPTAADWALLQRIVTSFKPVT